MSSDLVVRFLCKNEKKLILLLLLIPAVLFLHFSAQASESSSSPEIVRVGYYENGRLFYKTSDEIYSGYDVDYLYEIAKYTHWVYHFIDFGSFEEMMTALEDNRIDIVPALFHTPERDKKFLYSETDMGKINVTLMVPNESMKYEYNDLKNFSGMRVGVLDGSAEKVCLEKWMGDQSLSLDVKDFGTLSEMQAAVESGQIDTICITYIGPSQNYRIIAEFEPHFIYFVLPRDQAGLQSQLNDALTKIDINKPNYKYQLQNRFLSIKNNEIPVFTQQEKDYIAAAEPILVGVFDHYQPFSWLDKNGGCRGALIDYFGKLSQLSGLKFSFKTGNSLDELIRDLKAGKIQVIGMLPESPSYMASEGIRLTDAYLENSMVELSRQNLLNIRKIAVETALKNIIEDSGSFSGSTRPIYYSNMSDCMHALEENRVDAVLGNSMFTSYLMNHSRSNTYTFTVMNGFSDRSVMGLNLLGSDALYSILNRCIQYIDSSIFDNLAAQYSLEEDKSLVSVISRMPVHVLFSYMAVLAVLALGLAAALIILRKQFQREKQLIGEQEKVKQETNSIAERTAFFGSVSHDMRTPLNAILGYAELSQKENITPKLRDYQQKIIASGNLLLGLINDTLIFSKVNGGRLELHPEQTDTDSLFNDVLESVWVTARKKGVLFTSDLSGLKRKIIWADRLNFQKILLNLLSNAINFTPASKQVRLTVCDDPRESGSPDMLITVADEGIGISPEILPHIFEPFAQEVRTSYETSGTGMGLTIVKQLVDLMGGSITVQSEKRKGTTFTLRLHFKEVPPEKNESAGQDDEQVDFSGKKILLCEDNEMNREMIYLFLNAKGARLVSAQNGLEGVKAFTRSEPYEYSAVLMDLRMPVMDGLEAAREIRGLGREDAKTIPIIALSADAFAEDVKKSLEAGMNVHLSKPVDSKQLFQTLKKYMENPNPGQDQANR